MGSAHPNPGRRSPAAVITAASPAAANPPTVRAPRTRAIDDTPFFARHERDVAGQSTDRIAQSAPWFQSAKRERTDLNVAAGRTPEGAARAPRFREPVPDSTDVTTEPRVRVHRLAAPKRAAAVAQEGTAPLHLLAADGTARRPTPGLDVLRLGAVRGPDRPLAHRRGVGVARGVLLVDALARAVPAADGGRGSRGSLHPSAGGEDGVLHRVRGLRVGEGVGLVGRALGRRRVGGHPDLTVGVVQERVRGGGRVRRERGGCA